MEPSGSGHQASHEDLGHLTHDSYLLLFRSCFNLKNQYIHTYILVTEVISEVIETVIIVTVITLEREKERVRLEDLGRVGEEDLD
jgi:hypothetical protein